MHMTIFVNVRLCSQEAVRPLLFAEETRLAKRRAYICKRVAAALAVTKGCRTEKQRVEHHTILGAVMPAEGDEMLDATAAELGFKYGKRKGRERAATKAFKKRVAFDAAAATLDIAVQPPLAGTPLRVGEVVLCRGEPAELVMLEQRMHVDPSEALPPFTVTLTLALALALTLAPSPNPSP